MRETGVALSGIFLATLISNPLFGHLSDRGRKRWTCFVHVMAATLVAVFPHLTGTNHNFFFLTFMAYGFFFMASYPMVEAGVMQAVHDSVRGRAFGLWITIGGLIGNLSHWLVGHWVEGFGMGASQPPTYFVLYGALAASLVLSLVGLPVLEAARRREHYDTMAGSEAAPRSEPKAAFK